MPSRLYVRQGGAIGADSTELTAFTGRKGSPFFDGNDSLIEMGNRCANGEASQGSFKLMDPDAELPRVDYQFNLPAHTLVTWTEDASGTEIWLARGRNSSYEGGRGVVLVDNEVEFDATVDDCNVELRGQAFTEPWERGVETDVARLIALQAYTLNGVGSTAADHRDTCMVTVSSTHLTPNTNTVSMPAKTYPVGTQPQDVVQDCADTAGKIYGVVIHHTGGDIVTVETSTAWKRTTAPPPTGWEDAGFDDSLYSNAVANPQGSFYDPTSSRWIWESTAAQAGDAVELAFRTEFTLADIPDQATVIAAADNGCEVYLNGTLIGTVGGAERGAIDTAPFNYSSPVAFAVDTSLLIVGANCMSIIAWNENQPPNNSGPAAVYAVMATGGPSHLCLLYTIETDHDTYPSAVRISDHLSEWDPTDLTAPVYEPHWEAGKATIYDGQVNLSGLVNIYNAADSIYVSNPSDVTAYDYWVDSHFDSQSTTLTQATLRAGGLLTYRRLTNVTHRVSIIMLPEQTHLVTAGMSIDIKAAAAMGGQYLDTWQTRRVVEHQFEPRPDGTYWCHLNLDRTPHRRVPTSGAAQPAATTPSTGADLGYDNTVSGLTADDMQEAIDELAAADGAFIPKALAAAKGDIFAATADDTPAILTAGSDGQVLAADSGEATGLKWVDAGDVPTGDLVQIGVGEGSIRIPGLKAHAGALGLYGGGIDEDYDTTTTGLTWDTTPGGGVNSDTTIPSYLWGEHSFAGPGAASIYGLRAFSPSTFTAVAQCSIGMNDSTSTVTLGLMVAASGTTPTSAAVTQLVLTRGGCFVQAATLATTTWTQRGSSVLQKPAQMYLRIERTGGGAGGNDIAFWWSEDGRVWSVLTVFNIAITIAQIGYRVAANAGALIRFGSDFLRTDV